MMRLGLRTIATRINGDVALVSTSTNSPAPITAINSSGPNLLRPIVMASAYAASVSASNSVPDTSRLDFCTGRSAGRERCASSRFTIPSGTLTRKIVRQPNPAISTPPSDGPRVVPIADIVPRSPIALPVFDFGTVSPTRATVSAIMIAAPRPCAAREAMRNQSVGAMPHRSDATVNSAIPARNNRRRPTMSPSRPTLTISVVMVRRHASTVHWTA